MNIIVLLTNSLHNNLNWKPVLSYVTWLIGENHPLSLVTSTLYLSSIVFLTLQTDDFGFNPNVGMETHINEFSELRAELRHCLPKKRALEIRDSNPTYQML